MSATFPGTKYYPVHYILIFLLKIFKKESKLRSWLKYKYFIRCRHPKPPGYAYDISALEKVAKDYHDLISGLADVMKRESFKK